MGDKVKISIVVAIHNDEKFLAECLDHILNQSLKEIEIICIEDASTDHSADIVRTYTQRDCRIQSIFMETEKGLLQGRKQGVMFSRGEYVLFVDTDELLECRACEELYQEMSSNPVDILYFRTKILEQPDAKQVRSESIKRLQESYMETIEGICVFEKCLSGSIYGSILEDKLYKGTICKRAMKHMEEGMFPVIQDTYAFLMIAYFAQSYREIEGRYYMCQHIQGSPQYDSLNLAEIQRYCAMGKAVDTIKHFIGKEKISRYIDMFENHRQQTLKEVLINWMQVRKEQRAETLDLIASYWNPNELTGEIAKKYWMDQGKIVQSLKDSRAIRVCPREGNIRTIGAYYTRLHGGGVQRVAATLANIWISMGYQVVMYTDCETAPNDYYLEPGIQRVVLPPYASMKKENYGDRAKILEESIKKYNIDVVVYHAWTSTILLWDLLVCKLSGAAFVVHCHSVFPILVRDFMPYFAWQTRNYQLCDAVLTLSGIDRLFWRNFNTNVHEVRNPVFFNPAEIIPSSLQGNKIIWIGRFSREKHPEDALEIVKKVVEIKPETKLYMLGEISAEQKKGYDDMISRMGMENNIKITGYLTDISIYLQQASLLLMTSEYEGAPLALLEGMAYGLPCVMYELPYLAVVQDNRSIVSVKYKDTTAAAAEILDILCNTDKRTEMGRYAYEYIKKYAEYSLENQWKEIFDSLTQMHTAVNEQNLLMLNTLIDFYEVGAERASGGIQGNGVKGAFRALLTRKTVFWGAGRRARRLLDEYPGLNIAFCIDNNRNKAGGEVNGIPILHASDVTNWKELFVIVTVVTNAEIVVQLESYGLQYGMDYVFAADILT